MVRFMYFYGPVKIAGFIVLLSSALLAVISLLTFDFSRGDLQCIFFWHKFNSSAFKKNIHAQQHNYGKFSPTTQQY